MKNFIILFLVATFLLSSCNKNGEGDNPSYSKSIDFPINPCSYINRKMIVCHFGISSSLLDFTEESNQPNNSYSQCGFTWKKSNYEEIQGNRTEVMQAMAIKGSGGNDSKLSHLNELSSSNNYIKVGHFKKYESNKSAKRDFYNSHRDLTKEEFLNFNRELEKQESVKQRKGDLSDDTVNTLAFTEVEGVGDQAFYNHALKSLDVRFGKLSFSVFIETEFETETDILIAKKLAYEVWKKL